MKALVQKLRPQFTLRTILFCIFVIAVVLAIASLYRQKESALAQARRAESALSQLREKTKTLSRFERKERALLRLEELGASMAYQGGPGDPALHALLGERYALDPFRVELFADRSMRAESFTDDDAALIAVLDQITWLVLMDTKLTDAGLADLGRITELERLDLAGSLVTEEGVKAFQDIYPDIRVFLD